MEDQDKELFRLVARERDRLVCGRSGPVDQLRGELNHAMSHMKSLQALQRRLGLCAGHEFLLAGQRVREEVPHLVADLEYAFQAIHRAVQMQAPTVPTPRELMLELRQVKQEFGEYVYDSEAQTLSVETDPIELEGIDLGAFRIELHLDRLGSKRQQSALRIVALDANPPTNNESVTHPHVSDENLCAGDATTAIEAALASGRIADVFMLVRSVLTTYNPHSPYVALENWHGAPCAECGYVTSDEDDLYSCQGCDESVCSECVVHCKCCDTWICPGCAQTCPLCDERCCKPCLETCDECGRDLCHDCKVDGLCPDCQEKKEKQDEQEETQEVPELAPAHALGR